MPETTELLTALARAIGERKPIRIGYRKSGSDVVKLRTVEPTDLWVSGDGHYLVTGWCRTRQEELSFRLDRIVFFTVMRKGRPRFTKPHLAYLAEKETAKLLALLEEPATVPATSGEYAEHGDWLAGKADHAEARGDVAEAQRLWDLACVAWDLALVG